MFGAARVQLFDPNETDEATDGQLQRRRNLSLETRAGESVQRASLAGLIPVQRVSLQRAILAGLIPVQGVSLVQRASLVGLIPVQR